MYAKIAGFVAAVAAIFALLFGAYHHGVTVTTAKKDVEINSMRDAADKQHAADVEAVRGAEQAHAQDVADIDSKYQMVISNEKLVSNNTITQLYDGSIRLRKQLAAVVSKRAPGDVAASASGNNESYSPGLRQQDAEFLVRLADEADAAVNQLTACQAIVLSDRRVKSIAGTK